MRFIVSVPLKYGEPEFEVASLSRGVAREMQCFEERGRVEQCEKRIVRAAFDTVCREHKDLLSRYNASDFHVEFANGTKVSRFTSLYVGCTLWLVKNDDVMDSGGRDKRSLKDEHMRRYHAESSEWHLDMQERLVELNRTGKLLLDEMRPPDNTRLQNTWATNVSVSAALLYIREAVRLYYDGDTTGTADFPECEAVRMARKGVIRAVQDHGLKGKSHPNATVCKDIFESILNSPEFKLRGGMDTLKKHGIPRYILYQNARRVVLSPTSRRWMKITVILLLKARGSNEWYFKNTVSDYAVDRFLKDTEPLCPDAQSKSKSTATDGPRRGSISMDSEEFAMLKAMHFFESIGSTV